MERDELVRRIRGRIQTCHRLAKYTIDDRLRKNLESMAAEGEADIARLLGQEKPAAE